MIIHVHVQAIVARVFGLLWQFAQPLLFGLIGAAVILSNINPALVGEYWSNTQCDVTHSSLFVRSGYSPDMHRFSS